MLHTSCIYLKILNSVFLNRRPMYDFHKIWIINKVIMKKTTSMYIILNRHPVN
jgi:hypothetical protein